MSYRPHGIGRRIAVFSSPGELIGQLGIVAETEQVGGSGSTRVFPLGFGREPIFVTSRQVSRVALALSDCRAICGGVEKGDLFHGPIGIADEVARVPSR